MIFWRPLAIFDTRTSKFVCNAAPVIEYDVFRSAVDFADSISLIHTNASIGQLAHKDATLLKFSRQILKFPKSGRASNSSVSASFFWEVVSRPRHYSPHSVTKLDETSRFALLDFESLCNRSMKFITSYLLIFLSCSFEACLLEVQSMTAFLLPVNMLLCQFVAILVSVFASSVELRVLLREGTDEIGPEPACAPQGF